MGLKMWRVNLCRWLIRFLPDEMRLMVIEELCHDVAFGIRSGELIQVAPLSVPLGGAYYFAVREASMNDYLAQDALSKLSVEVNTISNVVELDADQFFNGFEIQN